MVSFGIEYAVDRIGSHDQSTLPAAASEYGSTAGVAVYGDLSPGASTLLFADEPGNTLTVRRDGAAYHDDHGKGALIVHFHNRLGHKAQPVALTVAAS